MKKIVMDNDLQYNVLIVEDDNEYRKLVRQTLENYISHIDEAADGAIAINLINQQPYDLVLLDMELPRVSGLEVLAHLKTHNNSVPVIVLTASRDLKVAIDAMKQGAYDYLTKPFVTDELLLTMVRALEFKSLRNTVTILERSKKQRGGKNEVIGDSSVWLKVLKQAKQFAVSDFLVYIEGESGSGKEILAHYIHENSGRRNKSFVSIDCGTIPENLIESELFGHEKGAYTGADSAKEGMVELANGGTLFLDEIGHIDLRFQQKLLTFVETKTFRRVGDNKSRTVDVRIIAATNKKLSEEAREGKFRSDLWYRLNVMKLAVPPLRERRPDILLLSEYFLKKFSNERLMKSLSEDAIAALEVYRWPGNIRELSYTIQRGIAISEGNLITAKDLGIEISQKSTRVFNSSSEFDLVSLRDAEHLHIKKVLSATNWNISKAAKILQIGRNTLHVKLKEVGLESPTKSS
jgi:DNA-binding NtrC family response regulator